MAVATQDETTRTPQQSVRHGRLMSAKVTSVAATPWWLTSRHHTLPLHPLRLCHHLSRSVVVAGVRAYGKGGRELFLINGVAYYNSLFSDKSSNIIQHHSDMIDNEKSKKFYDSLFSDKSTAFGPRRL